MLDAIPWCKHVYFPITPGYRKSMCIVLIVGPPCLLWSSDHGSTYTQRANVVFTYCSWPGALILDCNASIESLDDKALGDVLIWTGGGRQGVDLQHC